VVGGCSGFQYHGFEKQENSGDEILKWAASVFVDRGSSMYLDGTEIDWVILMGRVSSLTTPTSNVLWGILPGVRYR
jgi:Fe-S cluster assembly iron-binding protein IscA